MPLMKKCSKCKQLIPNNAKECPNCGAKQSSLATGCLVAVLVIGSVSFVGFLISIGASNSDLPRPQSQPVESSAVISETENETEKPTKAQSKEESSKPVKKDDIIEFGDLLDLVDNGTTVVVKAKISPSYSNKSTIDQNYFNIEELVQKHGFNKYEEIQYWAVADMTDGSESKVISFTVPKSTIAGLAEGKIPANRLGEDGYVTDLWILPSLLD